MSHYPAFPQRSPEELLSLSTSVLSGAVVVTAAGDVDAVTVPRLLGELAAVLGSRPGQRLVLDMARVTFLGSHGLAMVVDVANRARGHGMEFGLVVGDRHTVIRALEVTGVADTIALYHSLPDALGR
ncbi:MAG TPA: STAS domain-containing protein [Pseudonocardia sp.]|jgi:anti-sigma B factor antagonist|uniref:STAS domain-containing protein n=1 Tax=Pseudonocardia sp. TaxID=60912 RepID=UPI002EDA9A29